MSAAQARRTSTAEALSSRDSSRCSTVMNSCRAARASTNAMCRLTSSSSEITLPPLHIGADQAIRYAYSMTKTARRLAHGDSGSSLRAAAPRDHGKSLCARPPPDSRVSEKRHRLHQALQRMLVGMGQVQHGIDPGGGHVAGVDAADAPALVMDLQHDALGFLAALVEDQLEHAHHEIHRRVIIVQ